METLVRLRMDKMQREGGPTPEDLSRATALSGDLAAHGDRLMFGDANEGETAEMFDRVGHAIAVLALTVGEITIFGSRFTAPKTP